MTRTGQWGVPAWDFDLGGREGKWQGLFLEGEVKVQQ